eukprot:SAG11_NODE_2156_length_3734_cov_22.964787_1_plen_77_part_00
MPAGMPAAMRQARLLDHLAGDSTRPASVAATTTNDVSAGGSGPGHVLIVGATGLVGRAAVEWFGSRGWIVSTIARR